jgi:hypothetical protein
MSAMAMANHGVMEGCGAYNRHAIIQAGGIALALPLWEEAVRSLEPDSGYGPLVIADYGSSQGKNSLAPMRVAIQNLRTRVNPGRPIFVYHIDQPANDFNSLFEVLDADPQSYSTAPDVIPCAIGKSFYEQVLPANSVHLGWSSYAAVWLSWIPTRIRGHFVALRGSGPERAAFQRQGAQDWQAFLSLRAAELRPGGRLAVVLPACNDDGVAGLEDLMDHANTVLAEMVDAGDIQQAERERMVLGAFPRRRCDLLAPFQAGGVFEGLTVECCELSSLTDSAWTLYQRDGNAELLAARQAMFFRSVFVPSLALGLTDAHGPERRRIFADRFESGLKRCLRDPPGPLHSFVQTMVLAKSARGSR